MKMKIKLMTLQKK